MNVYFGSVDVQYGRTYYVRRAGGRAIRLLGKRDSQDRRPGHAAVKSSALRQNHAPTEHLPMSRRGFLTVHSTRETQRGGTREHHT